MPHKYSEKILDVLSSAKFCRWYGENGNFDRWIRREENVPTKEEIIEDIEKMFNLE